MVHVCNTSTWEAEVEDPLSPGVQDYLSNLARLLYNKMKQSDIEFHLILIGLRGSRGKKSVPRSFLKVKNLLVFFLFSDPHSSFSVVVLPFSY